MRVVVHKVGGGEESGVLLYKDTLGVFIRIGKGCRFIPWEEIDFVKTVRGKDVENLDMDRG